jgi:peptidoglycan-N-acetylglucosamine deacetylase
MEAAARQKGYGIALGSIWPYDTSLNSPAFSTWYILNNVRPGAVMILHDDGSKGLWGENTYQVLQKVLPALQKKGYRIVTLSELAQIGKSLQSRVH